jgi:hypothetical protein
MAQLLPCPAADRGTPKTILILAMEPLFPKVKASQERIYRMAERLSRDHTVDVATTVRDPVELEQSREHLRAVCRAFHPITPINPHGSQLQRKLRRAEYLLLHAPRHHPHHYFSRYSIDATIGKLSDYYLELPRPRDRQGPPSSR